MNVTVVNKVGFKDGNKEYLFPVKSLAFHSWSGIAESDWQGLRSVWMRALESMVGGVDS